MLIESPVFAGLHLTIPCSMLLRMVYTACWAALGEGRMLTICCASNPDDRASPVDDLRYTQQKVSVYNFFEPDALCSAGLLFSPSARFFSLYCTVYSQSIRQQHVCVSYIAGYSVLTVFSFTRLNPFLCLFKYCSLFYMGLNRSARAAYRKKEVWAWNMIYMCPFRWFKKTAVTFFPSRALVWCPDIINPTVFDVFY